jgi:hypothetical protein
MDLVFAWRRQINQKEEHDYFTFMGLMKIDQKCCRDIMNSMLGQICKTTIENCSRIRSNKTTGLLSPFDIQ